MIYKSPLVSLLAVAWFIFSDIFVNDQYVIDYEYLQYISPVITLSFMDTSREYFVSIIYVLSSAIYGFIQKNYPEHIESANSIVFVSMTLYSLYIIIEVKIWKRNFLSKKERPPAIKLVKADYPNKFDFDLGFILSYAEIVYAFFSLDNDFGVKKSIIYVSIAINQLTLIWISYQEIIGKLRSPSGLMVKWGRYIILSIIGEITCVVLFALYQMDALPAYIWLSLTSLHIQSMITSYRKTPSLDVPSLEKIMSYYPI